MSSPLPFLHPLPDVAEGCASPQLFTYPFRYQPHPLCRAAAEDITPLCRELLQRESGGKMFGVLVVEYQSRAYYLAAFSGKLGGTYIHPGFVPPVYDLQHPGSYFRQEEAAISAINQRIGAGEDTPELRAERKSRSTALQRWLFRQFDFLNAKGESKNLTDLFARQPHILTAEEYFNGKRGKRSGNTSGSTSDNTPDNTSNAPSDNTPDNTPHIPSGAGECCAPKLLQCAYLHNLRPLCMAEFWLGPSPKDELRIDGNFYPACQSKCRPILSHMLGGLSVEENPMARTARERAREVEYIYEDTDMAVVYKPSGLLTAPGKDDDLPSLLQIVRQRHPGAINAHRLDMDTSGLLVFALNERAYHEIQQQFIRQEVGKTYVAILERPVPEGISTTGTIALPLLPNPYDRPRQMVSYEHGKRATTQYELTSPTRVVFHPRTGRTHQLRVHAAHPDGLATPIKGDPLYGTPSERLYLHAESITLRHPGTGATMTFEKKEL